MYKQTDKVIWLGYNTGPVNMLPAMANRHGLIAGATGTGKTVTLKVLAEAFSDMGVPVFLADIKGDVSGLCLPGEANDKVDERVKNFGLTDFSYKPYPVRFYDVYGQTGIPVRTRISDMGPELLARILGLNDTQTSVLKIVFKIADDKGLLLIDTKDLTAMLADVATDRAELQPTYGNLAPQTIGAIQRAVINLDGDGGNVFFGEPALDIRDWIVQDDTGRGIINLLNCVELVKSPVLYSTFLLWMLSELYETLPEAGDLAQPKMVFFFDEAHLLFNDAPKALLEKVEQVARLIRSKGVGVFFISQSPADIPANVLAQLGNKIQHALRAYTPQEQKAVKAAAESYRTNPDFDAEAVLGELGTGEALLSLLDAKGVPEVVQRAFILPPQSFMGVADPAVVASRVQGSPLYAKYATVVDNESAYEVLQKEAEQAKTAAEQAEAEKEAAIAAEKQAKEEEKAAKAAAKEAERQQKEHEKQMRQVTSAATKAVTSIGRELGKNIIRGLFGNRKK